MPTTTFAELGLSSKVMDAVTASGYTTPTPIQAGAIPVAVEGRDVLGIAQTGTGKTAAFVLPLLSRLERGRARARMPRSLILAPTRELAAQVSEAFETYGTNHKLSMALLIGGVSFGEQLKKLDRGVDVLIATPGRLLDHFSRGKLLLTGVEILVIDEADRMLDMGFIPDIEKICKLLPPRRQTLFFSATMPSEITRLAKQFLKDPERVEVAKPATTAKTIRQEFIFLPDGTDWVKRDMLRKLIGDQEDLQNAIIFCNRKRDVAILFKSLRKHGFNAGALHGDMDQSSRMATLAAFRSGEITLLAASDVAARGLDIPEVSHVFNYDMPWQSDDYVHRIGRTGRAGRKGYTAALVTTDDLKIVKELEKASGLPVEWIGEPPGDDVKSSRRGSARGGRGGRSAPRGRKTMSASANKTASSEGPNAGRGRGSKSQTSKAAPKKNALTSEVTEKSANADTEQADTGRSTNATEDNRAPRGRRSRRRPQRGQGGKEGMQDNVTADKTLTDGVSSKQPREVKPVKKQSQDKPRQGKIDERVEGAAKGLGDNVPAFLKRPVRSNSS